MKKLALAMALGWSCALAIPSSPALAADESPEAIISAAETAVSARNDMQRVFGVASLKNGQYRWKDNHARSEVTRIVVSLSDQMAYAYNGDDLIAVTTVSTGKKGHPTPFGIFSILEKNRHYHSRKYDASMPFMQRIDDYGIAFHAGQLPGRPASRGCIRLPAKFAERLFAATAVGRTEVLIGDPVRHQAHLEARGGAV
jgi:hypothetical protein